MDTFGRHANQAREPVRCAPAERKLRIRLCVRKTRHNLMRRKRFQALPDMLAQSREGHECRICVQFCLMARFSYDEALVRRPNSPALSSSK